MLKVTVQVEGWGGTTLIINRVGISIREYYFEVCGIAVA